METRTINVISKTLQDSKFQEFVDKVKQSQRITIDLDEDNEIVSITGKQTSVNTAEIQINEWIYKMSTNTAVKTNKVLQHGRLNTNNNRDESTSVQTIELNTARKKFLEFFGKKHFNSIRTKLDISRISLKNGKLELITQNTDAIEGVKHHLDQLLYEQKISISSNVTKHLTRSCNGRLLEEFCRKHHVGTSLEPYRRPTDSKRNKTTNLQAAGRRHTTDRMLRGGRPNNHQQRGGFRGRGNINTGIHQQASNDDGNGPQRGGFRGRGRGRGNINTGAHHQGSDDDDNGPQRGGFRGRGRGRDNINTDIHHRGSDDDDNGPQRGGFRGRGRGRGNINAGIHHRGSGDDENGPERGGFRGGQQGRGDFTIAHPVPNRNVDLLNSNINYGDLEEDETNEQDDIQYETPIRGLLDQIEDDDDRSSVSSDSLTSELSTFTTNSTASDTSNMQAEIILCSDDVLALQEAKEELQTYSIYSEQYALTADEYVFILKQNRGDKNETRLMSIKDRCSKIRYYLHGLTKILSVHIVVYYKRGIWYVIVRGFKSNVCSAMLRIKTHLSNVAKTEVEIPISKLVANFISKKASSAINNLEKAHNITIKLIIPPNGSRRYNKNDVNDEQDDSKHCLKLIASISSINMARSAIEEFLEGLLESKDKIETTLSYVPEEIIKNIRDYLDDIEKSDDYDAIGFLNVHSSESGSGSKLILQIVSTSKEIRDEIKQRCEEIIEGYDQWNPTPDDYQALVNVFFVKKQPSINQFQEQWKTKVFLDRDNKTVCIYARSKMVAQGVREGLQCLASGRTTHTDRISVPIRISLNARRFVDQVIQPLFDEAKAKKIFIDTRKRTEFILSGRSNDVKSMEQKIRTIVDDIEQKLVTTHLQLPSIQSELFRENAYSIAKRLERETKTIIRDVKFTKKQGATSASNSNDTISTLKSVINERGQSIVVKKCDITNIKDVDAIANSSTTGNGSSKRVIPINVPRSRQDQASLFANILSGLNLAEQEHHTSLALPLICTEITDSSLRHCTKTMILAIKQFFAANPKSNLKRIILVDNDDAICDSFVSEVINNHTNDMIERRMPLLEIKWFWEDDVREVPYDENDSNQIEAAFQQYLRTCQQVDLELSRTNSGGTNTVSYSIHFYDDLAQELTTSRNALDDRIEGGFQKNKATRYRRPIIRYQLKKEDKDHQRIQLDIYELHIEDTSDDWEIIGITKLSIEQAKTGMIKEIQNATTTERFSVNLVQDVNTHESAIRNKAVQNFVKINFERDQRDKLTIVLEGLRQNVSQTKLLILLYINEIQMTTTTTNNKKDDELSVPKEWVEQEEEYKLFKLTKDDPVFIRIEQRMKETIKNIKIHSIERVQNTRLWIDYAFNRRKIQQALTHKSHSDIEMELFHGTRNTAPDEIYNGDCGFDMRFCENGLWGRGSYFAQNASYSCQSYSYKLPDGKRQVFLAYVLVGDAYDCGKKTDESLRMPPKKDQNVSKTRYNCVTGETGGSRVYIVYSNQVTYPAYLITFTV